MAAINGWAFIVIGGAVAAWSAFVSDMIFFVYLGGAFIVYGAGKLVYARLTHSSDAGGTPHAQHPSHHAGSAQARVAARAAQAFAQHAHTAQTTHTHPAHAHHPASHMPSVRAQGHGPLQPAVRICPNCRQQINAGYRFCPHCGWGV